MTAGRATVVRFGHHELETPALFASYRLGDYPTAGLRLLPWDITETQALLINAYDLRRPKYKARLEGEWNLSTDLAFPEKPTLIDSGAYYFIKHGKMGVEAAEILDIQIKSQADVGVVLDHPFPLDATDKPQRVRTTLRNTETMYAALQAHNTHMGLMPVVHGHDPQSIRSCLRRVRKVADTYGAGDLPYVGIGSLAPLAKQGNVTIAADVILAVRAELPNSHIHVFSMGSALLMLLAYYCGADSVDSQAWIVSAGFKYAQLPGQYVTRMARREYKDDNAFGQSLSGFADQLLRLAQEEDLHLKDWEHGQAVSLSTYADCLEYARSLVDIESNEHVHGRACHNLFMYNEEAKKARRAIQQERLDDFVASRFKGTRYEPALEHARTRLRRTRRIRVPSLAYS